VRQRMGERRLLQLREAQHLALRLGITLAQFWRRVKTLKTPGDVPENGYAALRSAALPTIRGAALRAAARRSAASPPFSAAP